MGCGTSQDSVTKNTVCQQKDQNQQQFDVVNEKNLEQLEKAAPEIVPKPQLLLSQFQGSPKISQMYLAIKDGNLQEVIDICEKDLMNPNENLSAKNQYWSVLHYAARFNNKSINEYLLKLIWKRQKENYESIINMITSDYQTPLMVACSFKCDQAFQVYMQCGGIKLDLKDSSNRKAIDICKFYRFTLGIDELAKVTTQSIPPNSELLSVPFAQPDQSAQTKNQEAIIQQIKAKPKELTQSQTRLKEQAQVQSLTKQQTLQKSQGATKSQVQLQAQPNQDLDILKKIDSTKEIYKILQNCINSKNNFIDPDFPHALQRITDNITHKYYNSHFVDAEWLRPEQMFQCKYSDIKLFDKIGPFDIKQGILGVCYLLSSLSAIAEYPERISKVFINQESNSYGAYSVIFYKNGVPTEVVIDDYIPCIKNRLEPLFSKPNGKELWVLLLEKCWAKQFSCYTSAEKMWPGFAVEEILGCPTYTINSNDVKPDELFDTLMKADLKKEIMVASSRTDIKVEGLVGGHAYSLISVYQINGLQLLKMRNPWGKGEINGTEYCDDSPKWTQELKSKVNFTSGNDGIFFLTLNEYTKFFSSLSIASYRDDYRYSYVTLNAPEKDKSYYYNFTVDKEGEYSLRAHQPFDRYQTSPNYKYSPCEFNLYKVNDENSVEFVASGDNNCFFGQKTCGLQDKTQFLNLKPGKYVVRLKMKWENSKTYPITISSYSVGTVKFEEIDQVQGEKLKSAALRSIALTSTVAKAKNMNKYIFGNEYYGIYLLMYFKNTSQQSLKFTINFPTLQNLRVQGASMINEKQIQFTVQSQQVFTEYLEIIDKRKAASLTWQFQIVPQQ